LVVEPGGTVSSEELAVTRRALSEELPRAGFLILAGSVPPGVEPDTYRDIVLEARARGVRTAVDTRGPALARAVEAHPWLIKPNREELQELIGRQLTDERALLDAAQDVRRSGVEIVIISLGAAGALIVSEVGAWRATPPQVSVVSTVGCGDALLAGAIHAASGSGTSQDIVRWGVAAGTANTLVASPGGVVLKDVLRLLPEVQVAPAQ
jgi:1-phosphofructokinase